jgi:hypothetical protein
MQTRNSEPQIFHYDRYGLMINPACYLVTVSQSAEAQTTEPLGNLPEWIFLSKHAIWLTEEEKPIAVRARHGDAIKKRLYALLRGR